MANITKCANSQCPNASRCHRVLAPDNNHGQSYAVFIYRVSGSKVFCEHYWPVTDKRV